MDFIIGFPCSHRQYDFISVIVDKMTISSHFLSINTTHSTKYYAWLYIQKTIILHGVIVSIISDRGAQFTAQF